MAARLSRKVYIVGAGPGDPGLLTVRAQECLNRCDVVVYDTLVHPAILRYAAGAEHIFAGKRDSRHSLAQEDINRILIANARAGRCVVRLKGGDPFVFGRGGEEALALREAGIDFEIVPGVTAGLAATAYAGIPVTHRRVASSVTLVSGHPTEEGDLPPGIEDLPKRGTLVFYMAVKNLAPILDTLLRTGHAPDTPAAIVEWGTYARQRTLVATLATLGSRAEGADIETPAILVVGETVLLRDSIAWFESRPLSGLRVVLTHTPDPQGPLEAQLRMLGAEVFLFPTIKISPLEPRRRSEDEGPSFPDLSVFNWIIFTSVNAAEAVFFEMERLGLDARHLARSLLCATGPVTAEALHRRFLRVDAQPAEYGIKPLIAALRAHPDAPLRKGSLVFLPRADIAPSELPKALRDAGAMVIEHVAYRADVPPKSDREVQTLYDFDPHLVLFTSSVAARNFAAVLEPFARERPPRWSYGAIGPVTTEAARAAGFEISVQPLRHEIAHFVEAICDWHRSRK